MSSPRRKHPQGAFKPINTLASNQTPVFVPSSGTIMVNEREPPRIVNPSQGATQQYLQSGTDHPQFGTSSPLRNPLKNNSSNVFNVPKHGHTRPEHHRLKPHPSSSYAVQDRDTHRHLFRQPVPIADPSNSSPDFVEIARPVNFAQPTIYPAPRPTFSTANSFRPVNALRPANGAMANVATRDADDFFDPNLADRGGSFDPSNFMDFEKASENIKALLEGAFEDQDEKPRTRLRKKNQDSAETALADKMGDLKVDGSENRTEEVEDVEDDDDGSVEGLKVKLLPHQIEGLAWMLDKEIGLRKKNGVLPKGGILADDMGLGKTIQAISLILSNRRPSADDLVEKPGLKIPATAGKGTLVVAPLALIKQWESEIKSKVDTFPKLRVLVHHGQSRTKAYADLQKQDIVITTYQTLTSEHAGSSPDEQGLKVGCFGVHWYRVILDEAHSIKNRNAKMTKAAYALNSVYRWCMTGTPMQNNLDELQSLIRFLRIKPYSDLQSWREQISQPMKNGRGGLALKRLQYFLKAIMKRRTKDILKKEGALSFGRIPANSNNNNHDGGFRIVARTVHTVVAHLDKPERRFYEKLAERANTSLEAIMEAEKQDFMGAMVLLLRLRQTCNHPELSRGNLRREKESFSTLAKSDTPSRTQSNAHLEVDVDDVADLLGNLTVRSKTCDSCRSKLNKIEIDSGAVRCSDCEEDFKSLRRQSDTERLKQNASCEIPDIQRPRRAPHLCRIIDSDDEDENVEKAASGAEEGLSSFPNASSDDQDVESGREQLTKKVSKDDRLLRKPENLSLDSGDDETDEEDSPKMAKPEDDNEDFYNASSRHVQPSSSTKIRRLIQILENESEDHKFIVFSEFTSMLDLTEPFLRQAGFCFARYDGKMKNDDREASLDRLRNDKGTRILLCSLRCGSLGLNLTAASRVVILEPFWNPFVEEQAIDRVHRLNQTKDVVVYRLTIADSVEERILELQEKKRELANAAIEGGKSAANLNMKDIMNLFKRDAEHEYNHEDAASRVLGARGAARAFQSPAARTIPPIAVTASRPIQATSHQTPNRDKVKQKPKFQIPDSLRSEYEAYSRRW